jgi:hypothetical protein
MGTSWLDTLSWTLQGLIIRLRVRSGGWRWAAGPESGGWRTRRSGRIVIYVAKAVAFAAVALAASLVTAFTAFFLGQALLASTHQSATLAGPGVLRAVIGSALYLTLCGLFAFAAAAIIRNTAATIATMIGLLFVLPVLVNLLPWRNDLVRWLPASAARAISATKLFAAPQNAHLLPPGPSSPCSPSTPRSCWSWAASCSASGTPEQRMIRRHLADRGDASSGW